MSPFIFTADPATLRDDNTLVLEVDPTLKSKGALFAWFASHLKFPDYFGSNWDAFDECLRDLSGVTQRKIVLFHRELPLSGQDKEQAIYVEILAGAVEDWRRDTSREFVVAMDPMIEMKLGK